jgi:hypothetical protein
MGAGRIPSLLAGVLHHSRWRLDVLVTFALELLLTVAFAVAERLDLLSGQSEGAGGSPLWALALLALLTGTVLAARHRGAAEGAPVAALGMAMLLADWLGAWTLVGLLVAGAAFWAVRSLPATEPLRLHFVLAARITSLWRCRS